MLAARQRSKYNGQQPSLGVCMLVLKTGSNTWWWTLQLTLSEHCNADTSQLAGVQDWRIAASTDESYHYTGVYKRRTKNSWLSSTQEECCCNGRRERGMSDGLWSQATCHSPISSPSILSPLSPLQPSSSPSPEPLPAAPPSLQLLLLYGTLSQPPLNPVYLSLPSNTPSLNYYNHKLYSFFICLLTISYCYWVYFIVFKKNKGD